MKQLVCEMCGGTDLVKDGGVFICKTCGCKYSVEEAKKMMIEGTVDVTGKVSIDRSEEIENRMANAINEYKAGNNDRAYTLFSEILNIDPNFARAIVYKALSDSWNSSIKSPKLGAASEEICRAIKIFRDNTISEKEYSAACVEILTETERVGKAMLTSLDNFKESQMQEYSRLNRMSDQKLADSKSSMKSNVYLAQSYNNSAMEYFIMATKLRQDMDEAYAKGLLLTEIPLSNIASTIVNNIKNPEEISSELIDALEHYINMYKSYPAAGEAENQRNEALDFCKRMKEVIREKEKREKEERIQKYWEIHSDEKQKLNEDLIEINNEIEKKKKCLIELEGENGGILKSLEKELRDKNVPAEAERNKVDEEIRDLSRQRERLGLFKGKQKKGINEQIALKQVKLDELRKEVERQQDELTSRVSAQIKDIKEKFEPIKARIKELSEKKEALENELTMDRPDGAQ